MEFLLTLDPAKHEVNALQFSAVSANDESKARRLHKMQTTAQGEKKAIRNDTARHPFANEDQSRDQEGLKMQESEN